MLRTAPRRRRGRCRWSRPPLLQPQRQQQLRRRPRAAARAGVQRRQQRRRQSRQRQRRRTLGAGPRSELSWRQRRRGTAAAGTSSCLPLTSLKRQTAASAGARSRAQQGSQRSRAWRRPRRRQQRRQARSAVRPATAVSACWGGKVHRGMACGSACHPLHLHHPDHFTVSLLHPADGLYAPAAPRHDDAFHRSVGTVLSTGGRCAAEPERAAEIEEGYWHALQPDLSWSSKVRRLGGCRVA